MYYSYLDDFHTEPRTWGDLFERNTYREADSAVKKLVHDFYSKE
jgi:hypothetical protein